ncbi:hypothetical protein D3C85_1423500 [compost metagenome]
MDWPFCVFLYRIIGSPVIQGEMRDEYLKKMKKIIWRNQDFDDLAPVEFQTGAKISKII